MSLLQNIPVSEIMTANVITIDMHQTLDEAAAIFMKHRIRHLPITAYDRLVGMLSYTDVKQYSKNKTSEEIVDTTGFETIEIEEVMRIEPRTVRMGQSVLDVAEILSREEFYALPVMDGSRIAGIVTTTDLIKFMLEKFGTARRQ
jgi:CBS domain-containing protein